MSKNMQLTYRERSRRARRARARYVDRCRRVLFGLAATAVIGITFTTAVLQSRASSNADAAGYKYYKNVVISYDYDLGDIAAEYADEHYASERAYLREVENINHLDAGDVHPGTHLVVPYYSEDFR